MATTAPPSDEIVVHAGERGMAVLLINGTRNAHPADPIRYTVSLRDVKVRIEAGAHLAPHLRSLTGQDPEARTEGETLAVRIHELDACEGGSCALNGG